MTKDYVIDFVGYTKWLKSQRLSERTIRCYIEILLRYSKKFDKFNNLNNMELVDTYVETEKSPATINKQINVINSYIRYLMSKGEDLEDWLMTAQKVKQVQFIDDILSMPDYEFILKKAQAAENWTVYLYARIAGTTGMRLCEMLQIKREHIDHGYVDLYGKGAKRRRIYFAKTMRTYVLAVLDMLGLKSGYVFSPKFSGEAPYASYGRGLQQALYRFGEECEIDPHLLRSHGFRHFFAKEFLRKTRDITLLADLLGHSNLNITRIYLKMTSREQAEFIDQEVTW